MSGPDHTSADHEAPGKAMPSPATPSAIPTSAAASMVELMRYLQRTAGNAAVNRLVRSYTAAPRSAPSGDSVSLDRQADQTGAVTSEEEELPGGALQAKAEVGLEGGPLSPELATRIQARQGGGAPLDEGTRQGMEGAFGTSFADVRVHTDGEADQLNRSVSATAFTTGSDVFFSAGTYQPETGPGRHLLAHELTHVVQQRGMAPSGPMTVGPAGDSHEQEADALGAAAAAALDFGQVAPPAAGDDAGSPAGAQPAGALQRHPGSDAPPVAAPGVPSARSVAEGGMVRRQPGGATAAPGGTTATPSVSSWQTIVDPGGEGKDIPRDMTLTPKKIFKGDKITVRVTLENITDPQNVEGLSLSSQQTGAATNPPTGSWSGNTYVWVATVSQVGQGQITYRVEGGGLSAPVEHVEQFVAVADLQDFALACQQASDEIDTQFSAASAKLHTAAESYNQAYKAHEAVLNEASRDERLINQLLVDAVFAGIGGAAGGAVGGIMKGWTSGMSDVAAGGMTDAAKDITKFAVRALPRLGEAIASGGGSSAGGAPPPPQTAAPSQADPGVDPFGWFNHLASALDSEKATLKGKLAHLISAARTARDANSKADFDDDPTQTLSKDVEIKTVTASMSVDTQSYSKGLWHTWLSHYAYVVVKGAPEDHPLPWDPVYHSQRTMRGKYLEKAAAQCGESADDWENTYLAQARQAADQEAGRRNAAE